MNFIFVTLSAFLKSSTSRIFLFLVILLGILLSFMHNNHLQKININKKPSKIINNLSKLNNTNKTTNKTKSPYIKKYFSDNYISSDITKKAMNLSKFMDKTLSSKNFAAPLDLKKNNLSALAKQSSSNISSPTITGYAVPYPVIVYTRPPIFFFPPPVVVVSNTTAAAPLPPTPQPIPVPEPSSMILGLIGLSGILGFRKKFCRNN